MKSDADKIIDLYDRHAHDYVADRRHSNGNEAAWLDRFCALLKRGSAVLDIGCGSGTPMAEYLVNQGFAVDGIDSSPTLIALCRERFPQRSWRVADMRGLALDRIFDGLLAWDSFFHLSHDDQRRMFPIFKRHASPRAALMFTSGPSHGEAIGSYRGAPLYHASLAPEEYRALLKENGFLVVEHVVEDPDCSGHTVWLAQAEH
ncbi:MAG: class I SAM-dependent methyltransferase [Achromobacter sp.]|uniref:class I SAM-dependent DNA methyltransferase n=1 Tax=Achromobacter sp. TaxID=134375 RepID=UPI0012C8824E|nr:class I SAM-dependent methyltransferase [Achromobacter sp.]MPS81198.1 class I SAM-dependent methyltransferase [Achromobacter sp.]